MPTYRISQITWSSPPTTSQLVTIKHKVMTDPDSSYITDTTSLLVPASGILSTPFDVGPLSYDVTYTIQGSNNCGGVLFTKNVPVGPDPCPAITDITGTVEPG